MRIHKIPGLIWSASVNVFRPWLQGRIYFHRIFRLLYRTYISLAFSNMSGGSREGYKRSGEYGLLKSLKRHFKDRDDLVFFDGGANRGTYSAMIEEIYADKHIEIYAFEPIEEMYKVCLQTVLQTKVYNLALGNMQEQKDIYYSPDHYPSLFYVKESLDPTNSTNAHTIHETTIDNFCKEEGIKHIDFLKLDIEGYELPALQGAQHMMPYIKCMQLELGYPLKDGRYYFQDFWQLLSKDYDLFIILKDGIFKIKQYQNSLEMCLVEPINLFCARKELHFKY